MSLFIDTSVWSLAQLCIRQQLTMLSTDRDFIHIAKLAPLRLWRRP
ncbi:MAG: hypothetical protein OXE54_01510 [Gammaproteobacteria bacterium]|nr:hypothetical protein [Gammaproteobacteria bacterium]